MCGTSVGCCSFPGGWGIFRVDVMCYQKLLAGVGLKYHYPLHILCNHCFE
jgi:hypothetical protein